jgi:hypothetical protein
LIYEVLSQAERFWTKNEIDWTALQVLSHYFSDLNQIKYQVVEANSKSYSCNIFAQCPSFQFLCKLLGINFKNHKLNLLQAEALNYMPPEHINFIKDSSKINLNTSEKIKTYKACLEKLANLTEFIFKLENRNLNEIRKLELMTFV